MLLDSSFLKRQIHAFVGQGRRDSLLDAFPLDLEEPALGNQGFRELLIGSDPFRRGEAAL